MVRSTSTKTIRRYPSLPAVGDNVESHTSILRQIKEALEIHERRTKDIEASFIRLEELLDLGVFLKRGTNINLDNILRLLVGDRIFVEQGEEERTLILSRLHQIILEGTPDNPQLAWDDYLAPLITAQGVGGSVPDWAVFRDGIYAYEFNDTGTEQELWINIHITHDYAVGTKIYPHVHWAPNTTDTGVVRWGFEYTFAKGHNQEAFPATTTIYLEDNITVDSQYEHRIVEATDAQAFSIDEADTLVLARLFRNIDDAADTFANPVFGFQLDLHYQKNRYGTISRRPGFDTTR